MPIQNGCGMPATEKTSDGKEGWYTVDFGGSFRRRRAFRQGTYVLESLMVQPEFVYCGNPVCKGSKFQQPRRLAFLRFKPMHVED